MDGSGSSLYSGPLSQWAQNILAALRAQSLQHPNRTRYRNMERVYGSQTEGSWTRNQEERRNGGSDQLWLRTRPPLGSSEGRESSHTPACSQSSQASSFSQSSCPQGRSTYPQAGYQFSQAYSQRGNHHLPPAYQCSRALSFSQTEVSPSRDLSCEPVSSDSGGRHTLSLQTPQTLAKHRDHAWRESSEGTKPCFILSLAPEDGISDDTFFPRIEHLGTQTDEFALACDAATTSLKHIQRPEIRTKAHQENWSGQAILGAEDSHPEREEDIAPKGQLLMSNPTEVHCPSAEDGGICLVPESGTAMFEDLLLPHSGHLGHITREVMDCDGQIMPGQGRKEEYGHTVVLENAVGAGRAQITESVHGRQNRATSVEVGREVVDADLFLVYQMDEDVTGNIGEADRDGFTIHVHDQMDATLGRDTEDSTPGCREESDYLDKRLAPERDAVECELDESKEISAGSSHTHGLESIQVCVQNGNYVATVQQDNKLNWGQSKKKPEQVQRTDERPLVQEEPSKTRLVSSGDLVVDNRMIHVMEGTSEVERDGRMEAAIETSIQELMEKETQSVVRPTEGQGWMEGGGEAADLGVIPEERLKNGDEPLMTPAEGLSASLSQERHGRSSGFRSFRTPRLCGNPLPDTPLHQHDNPAADNRGSGGTGSRKEPIPENSSTSGKNVYLEVDLDVSTVPSRNCVMSPLIPAIPLKRKHEVISHQSADPPSKICLPRRPGKWEPPRSSQGRAERKQEGAPPFASNPYHPSCIPAFTPSPQVDAGDSSHIMVGKARLKPSNLPQQREKRLEALGETELGSSRDASGDTCAPKTPKLPKQRQAKRRVDKAQICTKTVQEGAKTVNPQNQAKATCLTTAITCDPRVKDVGKLSAEEQMQVLEEVKHARAVVLTMVFQDGSSQLDPEQKLMPSVCGILLLMKTDLDLRGPEHSLGPNDSLFYLKLEHTPVWAQQNAHHSLEHFTRDVLLQVLSSCQMVVCYKAKDLLRTVLQHYRGHLDWKRVAGCRLQDPQVSGWLLDPSDQASCYQDLLSKHCRKLPRPPALDTAKVSRVISKLCQLYLLNAELCTKLQDQGLWWLYSNMELRMIPVLASMESNRIHVDKDALKRTSDMLGTKMKQLEQDAHKAAGQIFLVTSSTQLRTVLFEKLRLHERCENKKLPKTVNKQQQSTSEATLLQLQDLHPLPKIILEYRQVHKIKSTFVDGVLSCMMSKNYISPTWYQTSAVTGRVSSKHPNFQALPRQPVQITKKQYIHGKQPEVVSVHPRAMFIPQDGRTFLAADFCQVELRLLAHLSSDPELLRVFSDPQADVFNMLASQWKGVNVEDVTSEEREHAKRIVYSVVYGAGRERLSGILGVSAEQASRFQDSFLQTYREVQSFIQNTIQLCHKQGYVVSIMGRRRMLPNIHSSDWGVRMQAERQAVNFVVQGSAADLCKMAMIRIFSHISSSNSLSARLIAQLHDELLYEVEDGQVQQFAAVVKNSMESLQHVDCLGMHLKVPLKVAVSCGKSWGSMCELHVPPTSPSISL